MKKLSLTVLALVFMLVSVNSAPAGFMDNLKKLGNKITRKQSPEEIKIEKENKLKQEIEAKQLDEKLRANAKQVGIKVKGLYLGMFLDDAIEIYEQKLNQVGKSFKVRKSMTGTETYNGWEYGYTNEVFFLNAGLDKIVVGISLSQEVHFNAGDIPTKDFVRMFSKKYKISFKYEPMYYKGYTFDYYKYENASYIIQIGQGSIQLARKASTKKVTFD